MSRISDTSQFSLLNCFNYIREGCMRMYHLLVSLFHRNSHSTNNTEINNEPIMKQSVEINIILPENQGINTPKNLITINTESKVSYHESITNEATSPNKNIEFFTDIESSIFDKLDQTLLTNPSNYYYLKVHDRVDNIDIQPGVNFLAYCSNLEFHDGFIPVIIPKGYYTNYNGQFTLNEELWELVCPKCKQPISGNNPQGIGFRQCNVRVKYRDVNRVTGAFTLNVPNDSFAFAKISQSGNVRYHYVKFQIEL